MSNRKTILLYTDESTAGGVAHYNHSLLPALLAAGWRVFSAQPPNDSPMLPQQRELGVVQHFLSYEPMTAFTRSFTDTADPARIIADIRPDLVYFSDCCPISNIAAKHIAISSGVPFASICHSGADYLAQRFPACLPVVKRQFGLAREVIAISRKNLDILRSHFGLAPDKGVVVSNGRPANFFAPANPEVRTRLRAEIGVPPDGVLCFTSARFDAAKGYQHQLSAIQRLNLQRQLGPLYFAWAGTGELQPRFAEMVQRAGLGGRVRLLGQRWDIAEWLDAADVFVLTTMLEGGLPLSVMEAMAKGLPTVVTSVSGIAEVATGASLLLPDPNVQAEQTVTALMQALTTLARDPARRSAVAQAGRALAEREFRLEANLARTLALLNAAAGASPSTSVQPAAPTDAKPPGPLVSAVVVARADDETVLATLQNLGKQTLCLQGRLEIVVVDLGRTGTQRAELENWVQQNPNAVLLQLAAGGPVAAAWNCGLRSARAALCTCVETGSVLRTNALELMALALDERPAAALVYADGHVAAPDAAGSAVALDGRTLRQPDYLPISTLLYDPFGPIRLWRRSIHESLGWFDEHLAAAAAHEFHLRFALHFEAVHLPVVLGSCVPASVSPSGTSEELATLLARHRTDATITALFARAGVPATTHQQQALLHLDLGLRALRPFPPMATRHSASNHGFAVECFRKAVALDPTLPHAFNNLLGVLFATGRQAEALALLAREPTPPNHPILEQNLRLIRGNGSPVHEIQLMRSPLPLPSELELDGQSEPNAATVQITVPPAG